MTYQTLGEWIIDLLFLRVVRRFIYLQLMACSIEDFFVKIIEDYLWFHPSIGNRGHQPFLVSRSMYHLTVLFFSKLKIFLQRSDIRDFREIVSPHIITLFYPFFFMKSLFYVKSIRVDCEIDKTQNFYVKTIYQLQQMNCLKVSFFVKSILPLFEPLSMHSLK